MKEPKRIKLNPETPTPKEPHKYRLPPLDKTECNISGQDNDDMYVEVNLGKINQSLNETNENNSQNN